MFVMTGLDPVIHLSELDARIKSAHDEFRLR
jgi:hypothetical protein